MNIESKTNAMTTGGIVKMTGTITRLERTCYFVMIHDLPSKPVIKAYLGGKMRHRRIDIVMGDIVTVELDPANPDMVRIIYRENKKDAANHAAQNAAKAV